MNLNQMCNDGKGWKILNFNNANGPVITRKATPEELAKFEKVKPYTKRMIFDLRTYWDRKAEVVG